MIQINLWLVFRQVLYFTDISLGFGFFELFQVYFLGSDSFYDGI